MAAFTSPTELERLAQERNGLVTWLAGEFARSLTLEDAEDLVSEALLALASDPRLPPNGRKRRSYLRRVLRRDAIDELRHRHGRDLRDGPRQVVPLEQAEALVDPRMAPGERLEEVESAAQRHAAVESTLRRLPREDATVLHQKYLEQRSPDEIAASLGLSRTQYERRLTRAGARGIDVMTTVESGPNCGPIRQLLRASGRKSRDEAARVDVHLLDCLHCRAFALKSRGLLEIAGFHVIMAQQRFAARFSSLLGRESGAGAREARDATIASGAAVSAGTAVTVGLGTKVAIGCAGVVIAAVCAGPVVHELAPSRDSSVAKVHARPVRAHRSAPAKKPTKPQATFTPIARASAATSTPTASPTPKPALKVNRHQATAAAKRKRARDATAREFGPESATPQVQTTTTATASTASTSGASTVPPPPPPPPRTTKSQGTKSSSFSGEFRP